MTYQEASKYEFCGQDYLYSVTDVPKSRFGKEGFTRSRFANWKIFNN